MFDFQWRSTTSISRYFVPLKVKHSRLLNESIGNHETPKKHGHVCFWWPGTFIPFQPCSTIETMTWWVMRVSDSLHGNNLLQNRDPWSWCCKQWLAWKRCYLICVPISYRSDYSWSFRKKSSLSDRLSTLDCWMYLKLCGCCCLFLACFVLQWFIEITEIP